MVCKQEGVSSIEDAGRPLAVLLLVEEAYKHESCENTDCCIQRESSGRMGHPANLKSRSLTSLSVLVDLRPSRY